MDSPSPNSQAFELDAPESLGLDQFAVPSDDGLSLEELSQAYAALLAKGSDPYSSTPAEDNSAGVSAASSVLPDEAASAAEETDAAAACEITPRSILEAILFVGHPSGEPLTSERIAHLMRGVLPAEIDELVGELNAEYTAAGAPYSIVSVGPGYELALRPDFGPLRDVFYGRIREARLSPATIDVLAVVAYHQPVTAETIDRLRGRPSGAILSQLVRRDLLSIERPADKSAKPVYRTTGRFLQLFGIDDISELPRSDDGEGQA
jgi:segregation and condensation protein B